MSDIFGLKHLNKPNRLAFLLPFSAINHDEMLIYFVVVTLGVFISGKWILKFEI